MATLAVLACIVLVCQTAVAYVSSGCCTRLSTSLNLFGDLFKNLGKKPRDKAPEAAPPAGAKVSGVRKNAKAAPLEKISNKQGRDWTAYAKDVEAARPKEVNRDKQTESFNFKKADQFPNLYGGWIKKEGDQIAKQAIGAVKSAQGKVEFAEVLFDPVPNLDEVAFGTLYNKKLRKEVAASLKVPEYVTNRGGPATLEWSNLYWLNRLAAGLGGKRVLALSISGEGLSTKKPEAIPTLAKGITLVTLTQAKKDMASLGAFDVVVILSPCTKTHYDSAEKIGGKVGAKYHIALNSPYSANYDLGIGGKWELIYVMKRIPKGWIYRAWPKPYEAIVEGPDYEVFRAETFEKRPTLPEISKINMRASEEKYGATGNDRIFQNRL
jgi:hypothetical protein